MEAPLVDSLPIRRVPSQPIFSLVMVGCVLFVVLTLVAMLFYQGSTVNDPTTRGYVFTENFFSDLGRTQTRLGVPNTVSAALFFIALAAAGSGLVLFFLAFPQFFWQNPTGRLLSLLGSALGIGAGICFVGVAFTPANLLLKPHGQFVLWAFRLFPLAVACYIPALFSQRTYPRRYAWALTAFCAVLVGYYLLMTTGPAFGTPQGNIIQAVGQKVVVYASILSILYQAWGAHQQSMLK